MTETDKQDRLEIKADEASKSLGCRCVLCPVMHWFLVYVKVWCDVKDVKVNIADEIFDVQTEHAFTLPW